MRLLPEYAAILPSPRVPRYLVVLDASGSMSANFNGQCNNLGPTVQCANGPPGAPAVQVTGTGPTYYWNPQPERRIYAAKKAVDRLVRLTNMPSNSDYHLTRPNDQMAVVWFNESVPTVNMMPFSDNPDNIITFIGNANETSGDSYRSQGGTNGAAGLYRAKLLLEAAPPTVDFNGQTYTYENHVIFITDGISNQFLDLTKSNLWGGQSNASTYPTGNYCASLGNLVTESAACQITEIGGMYNGWDRPITQMVNVSQTYFQSQMYGPTDVYVVALSSIPNTGLAPGVATNPQRFYSAEKSRDLPRRHKQCGRGYGPDQPEDRAELMSRPDGRLDERHRRGAHAGGRVHTASRRGGPGEHNGDVCRADRARPGHRRAELPLHGDIGGRLHNSGTRAL